MTYKQYYRRALLMHFTYSAGMVVIYILTKGLDNDIIKYSASGFGAFLAATYYSYKVDTDALMDEEKVIENELELKLMNVYFFVAMGFFLIIVYSMFFFEKPIEYMGWILSTMLITAGRHAANYLLIINNKQ